MNENRPQGLNDERSENLHDWGDAPDISNFYGRVLELSTLKRWILEEKSNIITVIGIGGIGKTDLSIKIARGVHQEFDFVIWRKLINAPLLSEVLLDLVKFLSRQVETQLPDNNYVQISQFSQYLKRHRCLIVLDNVEAILEEGEYPAGSFRENYENYGTLLSMVGETRHNSCVILTTREKPKIIDQLEASRSQKVKSLSLGGLSEESGKNLFSKASCFVENEEDWSSLINFFSGNPFALELSAKHVLEVYGGNVSKFLKDGFPIFNDLKDLIDWHFERLSFPEKIVMYWLAINREPISSAELQEDILSPVLRKQIPSVIQLLKRRITLEMVRDKFSLQPILIEYMTERLIESIDQEIEIDDPVFINHVSGPLIQKITEEVVESKILWLNTLALIKGLSKDFIRETHRRLILKPIIDNLTFTLGSQTAVEERFAELLHLLRTNTGKRIGYAAGNILNLLCELGADLAKFDFSNLSIQQVYFQGYNFQGVNFANIELSKSVFAQTFSCIQAVAVSNNGEKYATADTNGEIRIWRLSDGQHISTLQGHTNWVRALSYSPDGQLLASASDDQTIRLWDLSAPTTECFTLSGHTNWVRSIAFSANGKILASGSDDHTIRIWDIENFKCLQILEGHKDVVMAVKFSPLDGTLASCSDDQTIRLWDVSSGSCLMQLEGHNDKIWAIDFTFEGRILASGSADHTIKIWDVETRSCIRTLIGHDGKIHSVVFKPKSGLNNQILVSGSADNNLKLWNIEEGVCTDTLSGHKNTILSTAFSSDGKILISGGDDQVVKLWEIENDKGKSLRTIYGYTNLVWKVAFSPDGQLLASGNDDQTIKLWDVNTGECINSLPGHSQWVQSVAFSTDGKLLASGSADHTIRIWDVSQGKYVKTLDGHTHWVVAVAFSPEIGIENEKILLASGSSDSSVRLWDVSNGSCIEVLDGHTSKVWAVAFSPDGKHLISGSEDTNIRLWDVQSKKCLKVFRGHSKGIWSVAFSPNGKNIASAGVDQEVRLWDIETETCVTLRGHSDWIGSVNFSPDGKLLASGSGDQTIRIWDVASGSCQVLEGHESWIWSVEFNPNGLILASGSQDKTIKLWDLNQSKSYMTLIAPRPYENMNIYGLTGLTEPQRKSLIALGAIETKVNSLHQQKIDAAEPKQPASKMLFICYSHNDTKWKDYLIKHLKPLSYEMPLISWSDREIKAGENWYLSIINAINQSTIALVLISPHMLASEFILKEEMPLILKRHKENTLQLIPIIAEPCNWSIVSWIKNNYLQVRPLEGKPLSTMQDHEIDEVLSALALEIYGLI